MKQPQKERLLFLIIPLLCMSLSVLSQSLKSSPVPIIHGINESHNNDWAQISNNGEIGICFFNTKSNQLVLKTIKADGSVYNEIIESNLFFEINAFLYDSGSNPHVFACYSDNSNQKVYHYFKNTEQEWIHETIATFNDPQSKYIYELSAGIAEDDSFHLLLLKTRSNPDSGDYYFAFKDAEVFYLSNSKGSWDYELLITLDTYYTLDEYAKVFNRIDIAVDANGFAHVIFGEQVNAMSNYSPSRLHYATNKSGTWQFEIAATYDDGTRDSGAWFPQIALDLNGVPYISYCYIRRVPTGSAISATLKLAKRIGKNNWQSEIVCQQDDGYYGRDGRSYTGALSCLHFDENNKPHIAFSDIASSHGPRNYFNIGNIRYAKRTGTDWEITTVFTQNTPESYYKSEEVYGLCMLFSKTSDDIYFIAHEIQLQSSEDYSFRIVSHVLGGETKFYDPYSFLSVSVNDNFNDNAHFLNYPNPFKDKTFFEFNLHKFQNISLSIYNQNGRFVKGIINEPLEPGFHKASWDGTDQSNKQLTSGLYFYTVCYDNRILQTNKLLLIK